VTEVDLSESVKVEISSFAQLLEQQLPKMRRKQKVQLLCDIFSIKPGEAR
jgi:hypothetical protein